MTEEVKKLDPNWQKRLEKVGKNTFQRQEMLRLGFWEPKQIPADEVASLRNKLNETVNLLDEKRTQLGEVHKKMKEAQNVKKLIAEIRKRRSTKMGMIFQDPATSLNPTMKVGPQIAETMQVHLGHGEEAARKRTIEILDRVGIPSAASRYYDYPFQFSGGMRQRAMIAIAISSGRSLRTRAIPAAGINIGAWDPKSNWLSKPFSTNILILSIPSN